jgi:peroxin-10
MTKNYIKNARQPEVIRTIQKDLQYTTELNQDVIEVAQFLVKNNRNFIRLNNVIKIFTNIVYHGFAAVNRIQTFGEEYTGVLQINSNTDNLPNKLIQVLAIILEFGGETMLINIIKEYERRANESQDLRPEARRAILYTLNLMKSSLPFIKALHRGYFYLNNSGQLQISKKLTGIHYVLVRFWLNDHHNLGGYKFLGVVTILQVLFSLLLKLKEVRKEKKSQSASAAKNSSDTQKLVLRERANNLDVRKCILCLENRTDLTSTFCGHLFCFTCILDWLKFKGDCPVCRQHLTASSVIFLQNYG